MFASVLSGTLLISHIDCGQTRSTNQIQPWFRLIGRQARMKCQPVR
jgi:hypothetical protein